MKAECTWGQGPDVLVVLDGTSIVAYENPHCKDRYTHGIISQGSFDLSSKEARILAAQLISAANEADKLDNMLKDYSENHTAK